MAVKGGFDTIQEREKYLVEFVVDTVRSSEEQTMMDRRRWKENEELFAGKMDWGQDLDGEVWQSRVFMHEFSTIIRETATSIQNLIFEREDFVNLIADDKTKEYARIREKIIRYYISKMRFAQKFMEYCLAGGTYGFATWKQTVRQKPYYQPKVVIEKISKQLEKEIARATVKPEGGSNNVMLPNSVEEIDLGLEEAMRRMFGEQSLRRTVKSEKALELCMELELVNPHNLFWDADAIDINDSPWIAERRRCKTFQLFELFEAGVLDKSKKEALLKEKSGSDSVTLTTSDDIALRQRDQLTQQNARFPQTEIIEYFGPLLDRNGDMIEEAAHIIIANGKHVLKDGINGYWDQKPPYRTAVFSRRMFKATGAGVADNAVEQQKLVNVLMSLFVDALRFDIYAPVSANVDKLVAPDQLEGGIKPGDVVQTAGDFKAADVFGDFPKRSDVAPQLFQTIEALKLSGQKGSSVNTMSSNPASRARITSSEIQSNDSRRLGSLNSLGLEIDYNCIEPIVKRTDDLILQFAVEDNNLRLLAARGVLTESEYQLLANMDSISRFQEMSRHYEIEIRGFRALIEREKQLQRSAEFISQINMMPPHVQNMLQWDNIVRDYCEQYGFDGDRWLHQNTPQDKAREENFLLQENQVVGIAPNDDDFAHLPVHYELALQVGPVQALVAHIHGHVERILSQGGQVPPPPPEVAQMLGMPEPMTQPEAKQQNSLEAVEQDMGAPAPGPEDLIQ